MKGGLASLLFALETLHRAGVRLRGDVVYCANTDEESSGAGSLACVNHGVRADAGICGEPTGFDAWVCCRGTVMPVITVEGRAGHAEMPQPHWREGGAVNAIEKAKIVLDAIEALRAEWRGRADKKHWCLAPGDIVPTVIAGGVWTVTYPPHCAITCDIQYLPANVDAEGTAKAVEAEVKDWIDAAAPPIPGCANTRSNGTGRRTSSPPRCRPTIRWSGSCSMVLLPWDEPARSRASTRGTTPPISRVGARRRRSRSAPTASTVPTRSRSGSQSKVWSIIALPSLWPRCAGAASDLQSKREGVTRKPSCAHGRAAMRDAERAAWCHSGRHPRHILEAPHHAARQEV